MRTAAICPTCATYINALCVVYDGPGLTNINVAPLDDLDEILQKINDNLVPVYGAGLPTNSAIYEGQIYINNVTEKVYIATQTGGGAADWVELAFQSSIPTTPSLASVLLVGNSSITPIIIKNLNVAPTQLVTIGYDNVQISDAVQGMITQYRANEIYAEDTVTGDSLQIAIDNTQNQTITFPDNSGQLALLSDTQLNLQDVTDNGNLSDNPIFADSFLATPAYLSNFASSLGYIGNGTTAYGTLSLKESSTGAGFSSTIKADINLTADRSISVPDANGTLVLSVNGITPSTAGDVTVPILPYKVYVAKISQVGASPITVDYLYQDTLTNPVTFAYSGTPGIFEINCLDFDLATTIGFFQQGAGSGDCTFQVAASSGTVTMITSSTGVLANGLFSYSHLEIRVYP